MFVKRISETCIRGVNRPFLIKDGRICTNPTEAELRAAGYKPLIERPCPKEAERFYTICYEEDENAVYLCYREEVQG